MNTIKEVMSKTLTLKQAGIILGGIYVTQNILGYAISKYRIHKLKKQYDAVRKAFEKKFGPLNSDEE